MWKDMLDVLKDMRDYLEKQDAIQERAKIDKPPKAQETMKPMVGGKASVGAPAKGIAKQYVRIPEEETSFGENTESSLSGETEGTLLKEEDETEVEEVSDEEIPAEGEEEEEEEEEEEPTSDVELKSLLKDIKFALTKQANIAPIIAAEVKKSLPGHIDKMLRKMGFTPTRPDIVKLGMGIDSNAEVKKSEDREVKPDIMKTEDSQREAIVRGVDKLTKLSWQELGRLAEKEGLFKPF